MNCKREITPYQRRTQNQSSHKPVIICAERLAPKQNAREVLIGAIAEACAARSERVLHDALNWCRVVAAGQNVELVAFLWHVKHDETPVRARVQFSSNISGKADMQVAKVHMCENHWSIVACETNARNGDCFILSSGLGAQCRATDRANGEAISAMIRSCTPLPNPLEISQLFPMAVRIVEADAVSANHRAQRLLHSTTYRDWVGLSIECQAHKVHACATKVFAMAKPLVSGMKHMHLFLSGPGIIAHTRRTLRTIVEETLVVETSFNHAADQHRAHQQYKDSVLNLFALDAKKAPRILNQLQLLLNADWRHPVLRHVCVARVCCNNRADSVQKVQKVLDDLLCVTRPRRKFAPNNWREWQKAWLFAGLFSSCHNLLVGRLTRVLRAEQLKHGHGNVAEQNAMGVQIQELQADALDEMAKKREEEAQHHKNTMQLLSNESMKDELFIIFKALHAEMALMTDILRPGTAKWQMTEMMKIARGEPRDYAVLRCIRGEPFNHMLLEAGHLLSVDAPWDNISHTEFNACLVWRYVLRASATLHQLCVVPARVFPFKVFRLLQQERAFAEELLATPACVLDDFTRGLMNQFNSVDALLSPKCIGLVSAVALHIDCTTQSTESKHSLNLRQVLSRSHTHAPDVSLLGVKHQHSGSVPWASSLCSPTPTLSTSSNGGEGELPMKAKRGPKAKRCKTSSRWWWCVACVSVCALCR